MTTFKLITPHVGQDSPAINAANMIRERALASHRRIERIFGTRLRAPFWGFDREGSHQRAGAGLRM
jgi:hypothetical protein